ncbi:MAG: metal ABC transporter permease [Candidatus Omnitrophica bacterium]|nr:metal ABC transporter permease [Candidatus Omnitrophota bacterium]
MWKPFLACLILTGIHAYLGIHVIERGVIFVDLALAQIAALGATIGFLFGFSLHGSSNYWFSLGATFLGAVIFSLTRTKKERIPQEAIIGIVYAVSAAFAILILSHFPEGDEEIRHMLVGNILLVDLHQIVKMAILYGLIGAFHWYFRKTFILISTNSDSAFRKGISIKGWDILFYLTFGFVVTSSVQIAGVLLVFSFLIVPAVGAILFSDRLSKRLFLGWAIGTIASFIGMFLSYYLDLPTGATVVCTFGGLLLIFSLIRYFLIAK